MPATGTSQMRPTQPRAARLSRLCRTACAVAHPSAASSVPLVRYGQYDANKSAIGLPARLRAHPGNIIRLASSVRRGGGHSQLALESAAPVGRR